MTRQNSSLAGTLFWGAAGALLLLYAWNNIPILCEDESCRSFITIQGFFQESAANRTAWISPPFQQLRIDTPVSGGRCQEMEEYFNKNFGRSDTRFSNYEGTISTNFVGELYCDGGVVIQSLPTGKKTCSAAILYNAQSKGLRWYTDNTIANCFVSQ